MSRKANKASLKQLQLVGVVAQKASTVLVEVDKAAQRAEAAKHGAEMALSKVVELSVS
jgi:hypothetical protein